MTVEQPKQSRTNPKSRPLLKTPLSLLTLSLSLTHSLAPTQSPQSRRASLDQICAPPSRDYTIKIYRSLASRGFNPHPKASIRSIGGGFVINKKKKKKSGQRNLKCAHSGHGSADFQEGASSYSRRLIVLSQVISPESLNPLAKSSTNQRQPEICLVSQSAERADMTSESKRKQ